MKPTLTPEQRTALIKARWWCFLQYLCCAHRWWKGWQYQPTITSRPVGGCEGTFCKDGALGYPSVKCRMGCVRATREVVAITVTDDEHSIVKGFWPDWMRK